MARQVAEENLEAIVDAVHQREVATAQEIARSLAEHIPLRTLQHRLNRLVAAGRLVQEGKRRSARYRIPTSGAAGSLPASLTSRAAVRSSYRFRKLAWKSRSMSASRPRCGSLSDTIEASLTPIVPTLLLTFHPRSVSTFAG